MYFSSKFFKTLRGWDGKSRFEALFFQVDKSMVKISIKKCYQSHFKLTFPFKILEPSYEISISTYDMKKKKKKCIGSTKCVPTYGCNNRYEKGVTRYYNVDLDGRIMSTSNILFL